MNITERVYKSGLAFAAFFIGFLLMSKLGLAVPLMKASAYSAAYPSEYKRGTPSIMLVKGTTDEFLYVLQVDPTTGKLDVTGGGGGGSNDSVSGTGAAVPAYATYAGMNVGGNLTGLTGTANGLKVDGSAVTQPISAASLPLPTGASTAANQVTGNSSLSSIDGKTPALVSGRVPVDGSGVTQPVSAASLPLPTGAATAANQTTANSSLSSIDGKLDYSGATGNPIPTVAAAAGVDYDGTMVIVGKQYPMPVTIGTTPVGPAGQVYFDYASECPCNVGDDVDVMTVATDAKHLHIFDSSGHAFELKADGVPIYIIPPGGPSAVVDVDVGGGQTLSVAPLDSTVTSGILIISALE